MTEPVERDYDNQPCAVWTGLCNKITGYAENWNKDARAAAGGSFRVNR